jgi:hypothetical protein
MLEPYCTPNLVPRSLGFELTNCLANYAWYDLRDARTILAITTRIELVMKKGQAKKIPRIDETNIRNVLALNRTNRLSHCSCGRNKSRSRAEKWNILLEHDTTVSMEKSRHYPDPFDKS